MRPYGLPRCAFARYLDAGDLNSYGIKASIGSLFSDIHSYIRKGKNEKLHVVALRN